jgi:hypothetical protein
LFLDVLPNQRYCHLDIIYTMCSLLPRRKMSRDTER